MDLYTFTKARPYSFHLTSRHNFARIAREGRLTSTRLLATMAFGDHRPVTPRQESLRIQVGEDLVDIRDQAPLKLSNIRLAPGWSPTDLLCYLDSHVFFWPGREIGPEKPGRNHVARYLDEDVVILRIKTADLVAANAPHEPLFSSCNSGATERNQPSGPVPRGPNTFLSAARFSGTVSTVVELVFFGEACLPASLDVATSLKGPFQPVQPI